MNTLWIMQGPPGGGKSFEAKRLQQENPNTIICSTDDFFYEGEVYNFRPQLLPEFHSKNLERAKFAMTHRMNVIVDNTNILRWQCREYVRFAVEMGMKVVFVRVDGGYQNNHGVPEDRVRAMREQMEELTVETVLASKAPWEK